MVSNVDCTIAYFEFVKYSPGWFVKHLFLFKYGKKCFSNRPFFVVYGNV